MTDLLSKLKDTSGSTPIKPNEIFNALPSKEKEYGYPRDVQTEVWEKWFEKREEKNSIIKMNTGSGKTVVGLIILQSCLNEGKGPAVYIVPDNYLKTQVCDEAKKLGITAVTNRDDYMYAEKEAILVTNIHKLVSGKSVFGMRTERNYPIGSILIDDVHACFDTVTSQFSLRIPNTEETYNKIIEIFAESWRQHDERSYVDIVENEEPGKNKLLPFWSWQDKSNAVYRLMKQANLNSNEGHDHYFNLPLLEDNLELCNCVITAKSIEITPKGVLISKIGSFEDASRRIFMSATLADDSTFISTIGLKEKEMETIITPSRANDIGDRLILFPQHLNYAITDEEIINKVHFIAQQHNVVVIVPSVRKGLSWKKKEDLVLKDGIEEAVKGLKAEHVGLVVFVNRYDGIDLPDDACHLLVIDGLPPFRSDYEKYVNSINPTNQLILREQIQKIEQGMGRGVRSTSDSCCIILMGAKLADLLSRSGGASYFSKTTLAQYDLSKQLWDLLIEEIPEPTVDEIFKLADYSLSRDVKWIEKSKDCLSTIEYDATAKTDKTVVALRQAFEAASSEKFQRASEIINDRVNEENDEKAQGYLLQVKAEYTNFYDQSKAQQILLAARQRNKGTLIPQAGIRYDKIINRDIQAKAIRENLMSIGGDANDWILYTKVQFEDLEFLSDYKTFELALENIGKLLGFKSSRCDTSDKHGPDNLWAIGDNDYLVIECKNGAISETISKDYCNQLGGAVRWFKKEYGRDTPCTPVMIHSTNVVDGSATPEEGMKIMTEEKLFNFKKQINSFVVALVQSCNWENEGNISNLLGTYKLRKSDIVQEYMLDADLQRS